MNKREYRFKFKIRFECAKMQIISVFYRCRCAGNLKGKGVIHVFKMLKSRAQKTVATLKSEA